MRNIYRRLAGIFGLQNKNEQGAPEGASESAVWEFVLGVMERHHFTSEAQMWLRATIRLRVDDLGSNGGGGYWMPHSREVRLFTGQDEAAVHELAHAWWHYRREAQKDDFIEAVVRLSAEPDPRYSSLAKLAFGYVHGIPEQPWEGLLVDRNDWEMFAGIASGTMGEMGMLPPYVRRYYTGLFTMPAGS